MFRIVQLKYYFKKLKLFFKTTTYINHFFDLAFLFFKALALKGEGVVASGWGGFCSGLW